jgi:hypothetical protein
MRKRIFPRIVWFILLNCVIFVLLVTMQFTRTGNFSQRIGDILINGRYAAETGEASDRRLLDGGVNVLFGGLEFRLAFPKYITTVENGAIFSLPGGTELSFISQEPGETQGDTAELRISAQFADDVSTIEIPFKTQRSSVIRNGGNDTLNIAYKGSHYQFSRSLPGLESGQLVLLASAPSISYRAVTNKKEFNPADFIVPQAETAQAFSGVLSQWINRNFTLWGQMGLEIDEDIVIAWCSEAIQRGNYRTAASIVPVSFSSDPRRTWTSSVYQFDRKIGVWESFTETIISSDREKFNLISRLLAEKKNDVFIENHLVEFLAIRNYNDLINNLLSFARELDPSAVTLEMGPGILESSLDMNRWRPDAGDPFAPLVEQVIQLAANDMHRDGDRVFVFSNGRADIELNLRLGTAIYQWGEKTGNNIWAELGRSLVLSVISLDDVNGFIPAFLTMGETGGETGRRVSSAKLYRLLGNNEHLPHATITGADGIWAWTAASSVNIVRNDTMMDIFVRFPVGETHYVMFRNVPPFALLQIYGMNWRRAYDFESYYNSSGWYYFEQERILVIKLNHRSTTENVSIYFTVPRTAEPEQEQPQQNPTEQYEYN